MLMYIKASIIMLPYNTSDKYVYGMCACFSIILWFCCSTEHRSNVANSARIIGQLYNTVSTYTCCI